MIVVIIYRASKYCPNIIYIVDMKWCPSLR